MTGGSFHDIILSKLLISMGWSYRHERERYASQGRVLSRLSKTLLYKVWDFSWRIRFITPGLMWSRHHDVQGVLSYLKGLMSPSYRQKPKRRFMQTVLIMGTLLRHLILQLMCYVLARPDRLVSLYHHLQADVCTAADIPPLMGLLM